MKTNRNGLKKKVTQNAIRLLLLVTCFVIVFGAALAIGIFGNVTDLFAGDQLESTNGIAHAVQDTDKRNCIGSKEPISLNSNLPVTSLTGINGTTWTYTLNANTVTPTGVNDKDPTNHWLYRDNADTNLFSQTGTVNSWRAGVISAVAENNASIGIAFKAPAIIGHLIKNENFTVKAKAYVTFTAQKNLEKLYYNVTAVSDPTTLADNYPLTTGKLKSSDKTMNTRSLEITMDGDNDCLVYSIAMEYGFILWSGDRYVDFKDLKIEYTATLNTSLSTTSSYYIDDSNAPIFLNKYSSNMSSDTSTTYYQNTYNPLRQSVSSAWPVYYDSINSELANYIDSIDGATTEPTLKAPVSSELSGSTYGVSYGGSTIYANKYAKLMIADTYDYSYTTEEFSTNATSQDIGYYRGIGGFDWNSSNKWKYSSSSNSRYLCAGMKTISITPTANGTTGVSSNGTKGTASVLTMSSKGNSLDSDAVQIKIGSTVVGYARFYKYNRCLVKLELFMVNNVTLDIVATDYGNRSSEAYRVIVGGIDKKVPNTSNINSTINTDDATNGKYLKTVASQVDNASWRRRSNLIVPVTTEISETKTRLDYTPGVWFYTAQRYNTQAELAASSVPYSTYAQIKSNGLQPIAYGSFPRFEYDFETGKAKGYNSETYNIGNGNSLASAVGAGYYRFTFYIVDAAGNYGRAFSCYVRVDYQTPSYSMNLSYQKHLSGANYETVQITSDMNGAWATGATTLKFTIPQINFSGNTLAFHDNRDGSNAYHVIAFDKNGFTIDTIASGDEISPGGTGNLTIASYMGNIGLVVSYVVTGNQAEITVTFDDGPVDGSYISFDWQTVFTIFAGKYGAYETEESTGANNDPDKLTWSLDKGTPPTFNGGVQVRVDRNAPELPTFTGSMLVEGDNHGSISIANKTWYTEGYEIEVGLTYSDEVMNDERYNSKAKVYYGISYVDTQSSFDALMAHDIASNYKSISSTNYASHGIDWWTEIASSSLDNYTNITVNLTQARRGGMRVIYLWAVDQAGNISALSTYYVLVDATTYTISASMVENAELGDTTTSILLSAGEQSGVSSVQVKRGDKVEIAIAYEDGYVPYKFNIKRNGNNVTVLENYQPKAIASLRWTPVVNTYNEMIAYSGEYGVTNMLFTAENVDSLASIASGATDQYKVYLELSQRMVVSFSNIENNTGYTSRPVYPAVSVEPPEAESHLVIQYVTAFGEVLYDAADKTDAPYTTDPTLAILGEGGVPRPFVPVSTGEYFVKIYIPKADISYVTDDYTEDAGGNQTVSPRPFKIIRSTVTITPKASTTYYGEMIVLGFTVVGFDYEHQTEYDTERLVGSFKLAAEGWTTGLLNVGSYTIVVDQPFTISDNYNVNVSSDEVKHTVLQRSVSVIAWQGEKFYGDKDPVFTFGVSHAQFDWYLALNGSYTAQGALNLIFTNNTLKSTVTKDEVTYAIYNASEGAISRNSGELVAEYNYSANLDLFDINPNFRITINTTQEHFYINQRTVVLDVSGQQTVIAAGVDPDTLISSVRLGYKIDNKDLPLASEINLWVSGALSLDSTQHTGAPGEYSSAFDKMFWYEILLDPFASTPNIQFVLGADVKYKFLVAGESAIIISLNEYVELTYSYGYIWDPSTVTYDTSMFSISRGKGDVPVFARVTWTVSIDGVSTGAYLPVGTHTVSIDNVTLRDSNGDEIQEDIEGSLIPYMVFVDNFEIKINPATIIVSPTRGESEKVYGNPDRDYEIGFKISHVSGNPFGTSDTFAGLTYANLLASISGSYARGRYDRNGDFVVLGARYDDVTVDGHIINSTDYYGYCISSEFASTNSNFVVVADLPDNVRFAINKKTIDLYTANFVGISKSYDGSTAVNYGGGTAYDISSLLARAENVYLQYDAEYTEMGTLEHATNVGIIFTNLSLAGDASKNYVFGNIHNDGRRAELSDGNESVVECAITSDVRVVIYYIDNSIGNECIQIMMGTIAVHKSDFTMSKPYDNIGYIGIDALSILETDGTTILVQIWKRGDAVLVTRNVTIGREVRSNYTISISLFFPIANAGGLEIDSEGEYYDPDVTVEAGLNAGREGVFVHLNNLNASVTRRKLDEKSLLGIRTIDREYNSLGIVTIEFEYAEGALAEGDTAQSVGLNLVGMITDGNYGYGTHDVALAPLGSNVENSSLRNKNYEIDIDALNEYFVTSASELTVNIARAKLMPNVVFEDKEYDAHEQFVPTAETGTPLTTLHYASMLATELASLSISGTVEYYTSIEGNPDANVVVDENGKPIAHNVLIHGLQIVDNSGNNYLVNYEIYGVRYSGTEYVDVGSVPTGVIPDYEIRDAVVISKKQLVIVFNNVKVEEKIYDGTRDANVSIDISGSGVVEEPGIDHQLHLTITGYGQFTKSLVGTDIPVIISGVTLKALDEEGEKLLDNYNLPSFNERRTANIVPRPISANATIADRIYNGNTLITPNLVSFDIDGVLTNEAAGYAVQIADSAHYDDKNVKYSYDVEGELVIESKHAMIYNPILRNTKGKVNYQLFTTSTEAEGGFVAYMDSDGQLHYGDKLVPGAVLFYYPLPTASAFVGENETNYATLRAQAIADGSFVGSYNLNGQNGFLVNFLYSGQTTATDLEIPYLEASGKVLQKSISISSSGIEVIDGTNKFEKMYDGTNIFFGKPDVDFRYTSGSLVGLVEGDNVEIDPATITAAFEGTTTTTTNFVVFSASDITGVDKSNYYIDGNSGTARLRASITKRPIVAHLADAEMIYGTPANSVMGDINYYVIGNFGLRWDITEWEGGLYLNYVDYFKLMIGKDSEPTDPGMDVYTDQFRADVYVQNLDGSFGKVPDNEEIDTTNYAGYYIRLSGISTLPRAQAVFEFTNPYVGTTASQYILTEGDSVTYMFTPEYTGVDSSTIIVIKKDIYVSSRGTQYTKEYGAPNPGYEPYYYNAEGTSGLVAPDNPITALAVGSIDYRPVIKWGLYTYSSEDGLGGTLVEIDKYARVSSELVNAIYVMYFDYPTLPVGASTYADVDGINNKYNVIFPKADGYLLENGVWYLTFEGTDFKTPASVLEITLPAVHGVNMFTAENDIYDLVYSGSNLTPTILNGVREERDEVKLEVTEGLEIEPVNVGQYSGYVLLRRTVKIDDDDHNNYVAIWKSARPVTINVAKASPGLRVATTSATYNGEEYHYVTNDSFNGLIHCGESGVTLRTNYVDISYELVHLDGSCEPIGVIKKAGTYRVTASLNSEFEENYTNYKAETVTATFTMLRAVVDVAISTTFGNGNYESYMNGDVIYLGAKYDEDATYSVDFSATMAIGTPSEVKLSKSDLGVNFSKEITSPGRYPFSVQITNDKFDKDNYNLIHAQGVLELTTNIVTTTNAVVELDDSKGIVANRLVAKTVRDDSATGDEITLKSSIEQYMPYISKDASVAAIVKLSLYYGSNLVIVNGSSIKVDLELPEEASNLKNKVIYSVTPEGGLKRLDNYTVSPNGKLSYETDYLGTLVFVDLVPQDLPLWAKIAIGLGVTFVALCTIGGIVAYVIRKSQLKKLI